LVDHEDFDEAINMLLDPLISGNHITDSQHRSIILAFLAQDKPKFALQYVQIRQPPQKDLTDIQLHVRSLEVLSNYKFKKSCFADRRPFG